MPCTTILVGKNATYDGSTIMARNEDAVAGAFAPKRFTAVRPEDQPRHYRSVLSSFEIDLPEAPMRYTAMPNALTDKGIWGETGFNTANVAMSETETITTNARVLGADPLVKSGIGEEDMLTLVLPYIHSAREGVERLGELLRLYGTYEKNGVGFQDVNEIWWLETIGGHHWIAKRVPDDGYVVMPNQQGIDSFDFPDACGERKDHMCSFDLIDFIRDNHLDVRMSDVPLEEETTFDVRNAFGSHTDSDHVYNTPRAWFMERCLNPHTFSGSPEDDDLPWSMVPEHKVTIEDIKYVLSSYYQGTEYNPYLHYGDLSNCGKYRPIGVNRNNFLGITQLRPYVAPEIMAVEWIAEGSNAFNAIVPFYGNVDDTPAYLANTTGTVTSENFYWANRIIGALADAHFSDCIAHIERYQDAVNAYGHDALKRFDALFAEESPKDVPAYLRQCNAEIAQKAKELTEDVLGKVLFSASLNMKNRYSRSDG